MQFDCRQSLLYFRLDAAAASIGVFRKALVVGQVEHFGEASLALCGRAGGEQVRLTLRQVCGVDEGLEIHVQDFADASELVSRTVLRLTERKSFLPLICGNLKFECCSTVASAGADRVPADDSVELVACREVQLHAHVGLPHVHEVGHTKRIYRAGARWSGARDAPERPCDRIEQSGLAVPVVAAEAGDVNALEVQRRHIVAVAHEVFDAEPDGDQGVGLAFT